MEGNGDKGDNERERDKRTDAACGVARNEATQSMSTDTVEEALRTDEVLQSTSELSQLKAAPLRELLRALLDPRFGSAALSEGELDPLLSRASRAFHDPAVLPTLADREAFLSLLALEAERLMQVRV